MTHYSILGGGRLARHMHHYLSLLEIPCSVWTRDRHSGLNTLALPDAKARLEATVASADRVLLLVSDAAIAKVLKRYPFLHDKTLIHCSGALSLPGIAGAHPLMTFSHTLYPLEHYQRIPFMVDRGCDFHQLLPGLPNPHHAVATEQRAFYHALCVMAGNFSQLLWQSVNERFNTMDLPSSVLNPYLQQVVENFVQDPHTAVTGPLTRGDHATIDRNLAALTHDPLQGVYRAFLELHQSQHQRPALKELSS